MRKTALETITAALNQARVRYLVVSELAVNAHGYIRLTTVIDLVIALYADNIHRAFHALCETGYHPRAPITAQGFADAE